METERLVGQSRRNVHLPIAEDDGTGSAFAATGRNDQGGVRVGANNWLCLNASVHWPKRPIFKTTGIGMAGQIKAAAAGDQDPVTRFC